MSRIDEDQKSNQSHSISTRLSGYLSQLTLAIIREEKDFAEMDLKKIFQLDNSILAKYQIHVLTLDYYLQSYTVQMKEIFIKIFGENALSIFQLFQQYFPDGVRIIYLPQKSMETIPYEFSGQMILLSIYLSAKQYILAEFKDSLTSPKIKKANADLGDYWNKINKILMELYDLPLAEDKNHDNQINKLQALIQDFYNHIRVRLLPLIMNGRSIPKSEDIEEITEIIKLYERNLKINIDKNLEKELYRDIFILNSENHFQLIETHFSPTQSQTVFNKNFAYSLKRSPTPFNLLGDFLPNFKVVTHGIYKESFVRVNTVHINFGSPAPKNNSNEHEINYQTFLNLEQIMQNIRCTKIQAILLSKKNHLPLDKIFEYSLKLSRHITEKIQDHFFNEDKEPINHIKILKGAISENNMAGREISLLYSTTHAFFSPKFFYIYLLEMENKHLLPMNKMITQACRLAQYALEDLHFSCIPLQKNADILKKNDPLWQNFMVEIFLCLKSFEKKYGYLKEITINSAYFQYRSRLTQAARDYLAAQKQKTTKSKLDSLLNQFKKIEESFLAGLKHWFSTLAEDITSISTKITHTEVKLFKFLLSFSAQTHQKSSVPGLIPAIIIILLQNLELPLLDFHMVGGGSFSGGGNWQLVESLLEYLQDTDIFKFLDSNDLSTFEPPSKLQFFLQTPYFESLSPTWINHHHFPSSPSKLDDEKKTTNPILIELFKQLNPSPARPSYFPTQNLTLKKKLPPSSISKITMAPHGSFWPQYIKPSGELKFLISQLKCYLKKASSPEKISVTKEQILYKIAIARNSNPSLDGADELSLVWLEFFLKSKPETDSVFMEKTTQLNLYEYLNVVRQLFPKLPLALSFLENIKIANPLPEFWKLIEYFLWMKAKNLEYKDPLRSFFFDNSHEGIYQSIAAILSTRSQFINLHILIQITKLKSYLILPKFFHELFQFKELDQLLYKYTNNHKMGPFFNVTQEDIKMEISKLFAPPKPPDTAVLENIQKDVRKYAHLYRKPAKLKRMDFPSSINQANTSDTPLNLKLRTTWLELFLKRIPEAKLEPVFQNKSIRIKVNEYFTIVKEILKNFVGFNKAFENTLEIDYVTFLNLTDGIFKLRISHINQSSFFYYEHPYEKVYQSIVGIWRADPENFYATLISQIRHLNAYLSGLEEKSKSTSLSEATASSNCIIS